MAKTETHKIVRFFNLFGKGKLFCYSIDKNRVSRMVATSDLQILIARNSDAFKNDAYFYVNNGGTKQNDIRELVACFIDIDVGKDSLGNYLPLSEVGKRKKKIYKALENFSPMPNVIVQTRNGYHVYWLIEPLRAKSNLALWNKVQARLHNSFVHLGSDAKVGKVNQIMRVPYTYWYKDWNKNHSKFAVTCEIWSQVRHKLEGLNKALSKVSTVRRSSIHKSWEGAATKPKLSDAFKEGADLEFQTGLGQVSSNNKTLNKAINFLQELSSQLRFKGMAYSAQAAYDISQELTQLLKTV